MTPGIITAQKANIKFTIHQYEHDPTNSYGIEAANVLDVNPAQVFKTLVAIVDGKQFVVVLVPVSQTLDLKALAAAFGGKKAAMANQADAERITGYVAGGISPLGQRKQLPTVVDESALDFDSIYISAGRRGLEIQLNPVDLVRLCKAMTACVAK